MPLQIPTRSNFASYRQSVELDGVVYRLRLYWNTRSESWYVDVADANDAPVLSGLKLTNGWFPNNRYVFDGVPPGLIGAVTSVMGAQKPGRDDMGGPGQLLYVTEDEKTAAIEAA